MCTISGQSNIYEEVQDVIFEGLSVLLPLITTELLQVNNYNVKNKNRNHK